MSVTGSRAADPPDRWRTPPFSVGRGRLGLVSDLSLLAFCVAMLWLMHVEGGSETVPYHLLYLVLTLAYGFRVWPLPPTIAVVLIVTASTGLVMYSHYQQGVIDAAELTEIPLMPALFLAMVWHARRRATAQAAVEAMADRQLLMLDRERTFFRNTSHAIRTPVTIARGHLELAVPEITSSQPREDVQVALRQLDRMSVLSHRLLGLAQLDSGETPPTERMHLKDFIEDLGESWARWDTRTWHISCPDDGDFLADPAWLGLAVDALVENAIHFTQDGGRIKVVGATTPTHCLIRVSDDGPGIPEQDLEHVFERFWHRLPPNGPMGSGLGLAMALGTARASGGDVRAGNNDTGGAFFELSIPRLVETASAPSRPRLMGSSQDPGR